MAYVRLPKPGSNAGPCIEACEHGDCMAIRAMALVECIQCGKPIGYDREVVQKSYLEDMDDEYVMRHADCHAE